jgi:cell division protease FtsH
MDGFDSFKGVIIMAATNRAEIPRRGPAARGTFDRQVVVDKPDVRGARPSCRYTRNIILAPPWTFACSPRTPGWRADLANIINEAALWPPARAGCRGWPTSTKPSIA